MDEAIMRAAKQQRAIGMQRLGWMLDAFRLEVGLVEIVRPEDDAPIERVSWRSKQEVEPAPDPRNPRFLPCFNGYGYIIRDVVPND